MPEPLRLDVELGAKGVASGIKEISDETDGLKVSAHKASFAVKSFAHDISSAKDATDVASAALGAFTRLLGSSVAATVVAAGAKAVYDAYSEITSAVTKAKESLDAAYETTKKGGIAENFSEGVTQAKEFEKVADSINKKIKEIGESPLQNLIDAITGSTDKLRELAKTAEDEAAARRLAASEAELAYQKSVAGADAEKKALLEIDKTLKQQLDSVNVLSETKTAANLTEAAEIKKNALLQAEAQKEREASEKNYIEVIKERAKQELKIYEAEAKARTDAQKIAKDFEAEQQKAHTEELRRSAEKVAAIEKEIAATRKKRAEILENIKALQAELAQQLVRSEGTGRGPGQRPTSAEVGMQRAIARGTLAGQREQTAQTEQQIAEELKQQGKPSDKSAVRNEAIRRAEEAAKEAAKSQQKELDKLNKALKETDDKLKELNDQLKESKKAQEELTKEVEKSKDAFKDLNISVDKMDDAVNLVTKSFEKANEKIIQFNRDSGISKAGESFSGASKAINLFKDGLSAVGKTFDSLTGSAKDLAKLFDDLGNMQLESIETDTINTQRIILSK